MILRQHDTTCDIQEMYKHGDSLSLSYDGERLRWSANFETLKVFVNIIEFKGKWSSPGGKARMFTCSRSDTTLTWYPGKKNSLIYYTVNPALQTGNKRPSTKQQYQLSTA